jgi:hypothetical protein
MDWLTLILSFILGGTLSFCLMTLLHIRGKVNSIDARLMKIEAMVDQLEINMNQVPATLLDTLLDTPLPDMSDMADHIWGPTYSEKV